MKRIIGFICLLNWCILPFSFAQIKVTKENGITVVHNPAEPLDKKVKELKFIEEVNISCNEENGYDFHFNNFVSTNNFLEDNDKSIYLFDKKKKNIFKFDKDGNFLLKFGREGEGPGEFTVIYSILIDNNDQIIIEDYNLARVSYFQKNGKFVKSLQTKKKEIFGNNFYAESKFYNIVGQENFLLRNINVDLKNKTRTDTYILYDKTFRPKKQLFSIESSIYTNPEKEYAPSNEPKVIFNGDKVAVVKKDTYDFEICDNDGKTEKKIFREYKRVNFPREEREYFEKRYGASPKYMADILLSFFLENNEVWIINSTNFKMFDVFNSEGKFIKQYSFDVDFTKLVFGNFKFDKKNGKITFYAGIKDEDGYSHFKKYRVEVK